ncbi:hypothetical protein DGMP_12430 [Desulfomarina profundi]|uniref:Conjugal transfer protein TraB n=1 Tax=Desulfomarina profundi TaxID=2772557 RepID=A0A8D5FH54_9BACT|nr:hypothetical protein [Desulfomarina profundi]BCL60550.1 hypothetical protein DGMP_12430 [Desulfomarina profundi]
MAAEKKNANSPSTGRGVPEEMILKISKEIAVKFIEVGRITPTNFPSIFSTIHSTISNTAGKKGND